MNPMEDIWVWIGTQQAVSQVASVNTNPSITGREEKFKPHKIRLLPSSHNCVETWPLAAGCPCGGFLSAGREN